MGIYSGSSATAPTNKTSYAWVKYIGEDGLGAGDMLKSTYDTNDNGIVDDSDKLGGQLPEYYQQSTNGLTAETALADADTVPFYDVSATANRKSTWSNIKSVLKTYFDTLYNNYTLPTASDSVKGGIKIGANLTMDGDTLNATGGGGGGIAPSNVANIVAKESDCLIKLTWQDPNDTYVDGNLLCTWQGTKVVYKTGSYPTNETDGTLVIDSTTRNAYSDTPLTITGLTNDTPYYFAFFPYSDQGVVNKNIANRITATPKAYILYGFKINKNDSNPATRITYTEMAAGFTPASMNYTAGTFNYGSWADAWFIEQNKPCMVEYNGTIDYYLNPNDYTKKEDGTASDIANSSYGGNAMAYFPLVWFKRWESGDYEYVNVCNIQLDETYKAYAHTRADGSVMDYKLIAMFEGSYISSKMRSLSGQTVGVSQTANTEISYATANGSLWYTQSFSEWSLIADLLRLISRSDDAQTAFGYGIGGAQAALATGSLNNKGQFFGYSAAQSTVNAVKVFHIENFWGNAWNRIAGLMNLSGEIYTKAIPPYNTTGSGYTNTSLVPAGTNGGYANLTKMTDHGRVPYNASGSETTYTCDGFWFNNSQANYARVGGRWDDSALLGFSCVRLRNAASEAGPDFCACLSCEQPAA